ncbi:hypothetical protein PIB30_006441 [Stylosanthes scabra]|uniref:DUF7699 domain-containing protein n=1 Tax=Stylosanthes scabra TaxID=79078 RepID=A0ABU6U5T4_9FABA|nr:hypothetical protein [Stylosanthes scabra]
MANTHELSTQSEGSDQGSYSDDFERDPDFEETESKFSSLSLSLPRHKPKSSDVVVTNPEETEINDVLIQRIKEHLEIINGGGERKYPPSSFVLDCKGDACTGDVVLFEQNVYEMFNIASRRASGPSCGKRTVAGRIVKESYGTAKQQHTFTIEVLWSKGEKPFPPLHPLLIKGRNLYRLKTLRQKWEDEGERQKILREKHSRGSIARADREARVQEKQEKVNRKTIMENRVSRRKCSVINHPEETDTSIDEKPLFPSALTTNIRNKMSVNKPPGVTEPWGKFDCEISFLPSSSFFFSLFSL